MKALTLCFVAILICSPASGELAHSSDLVDALVFVCGNGDLDKARVLIESHHADINGRNDMGFTPLWAASKNGHLPVVRLLLEKKASIDARAWEGETPLIAAAAAGQTSIVKYLIENGADETLRDGSGWTARKWAEVREHGDTYRYLAAYDALHYTHAYLVSAICAGNLRQVQEVISRGFDVNFRGLRKNYMPPLSIAVKEGQHKVARYLIDKEADVDLVASNGVTPLFLAVQKDDRKMIELLLENGAKVADQKGAESALDLARRKGTANIVSLLETKRAEEDLIKEKTDEYLAVAKQLAEFRDRKPGELNDSEKQQAISLIRKIEEIEGQLPPDKIGRVRFSVEFRLPLAFLQEGENYRPHDPNLATVAAFGNLKAVVEMLGSGTSIDETTGLGETPLLMALARNCGLKDSDGRHQKMIRFLIDKGADVSTTDMAGRTPLIVAAAGGDLATVKLLLSKGASVEAKDSAGETALAIARKKGHKAVAQALERAAPKKPAAVSASKRRAAPAEEDD
jgi:ankyrin repeat protein